MIKETRKKIESLRSSIEREHTQWFEEAQKIAEMPDTEMNVPRVVGRQVHKEAPLLLNITGVITLSSSLIICCQNSMDGSVTRIKLVLNYSRSLLEVAILTLVTSLNTSCLYVIHYVIHACFVSHVTHSCLFLCGIHCYFECSSNSITFASYYNRLWAQTRLSERFSLVVRVRSRLKVTGTMAEGKTVSIIPLNGKNYPSWRVQCRMALMRESLWGIVAGTEQAPDETAGADERAKFSARSDRALAGCRPFPTLPHRRPG